MRIKIKVVVAENFSPHGESNPRFRVHIVLRHAAASANELHRGMVSHDSGLVVQNGGFRRHLRYTYSSVFDVPCLRSIGDSERCAFGCHFLVTSIRPCLSGLTTDLPSA